MSSERTGTGSELDAQRAGENGGREVPVPILSRRHAATFDGSLK